MALANLCLNPSTVFLAQFHTPPMTGLQSLTQNKVSTVPLPKLIWKIPLPLLISIELL